MKDFFVSYNHADRAWAEWVAWILEESSYTVVLQSWDFRPGSNFALEMHSAAQSAERTIAILSPDYLSSQFTTAEWAAAFAQDPTATQGKLLPVRVRECDPEGLLRQIIYINLVGLPEKEARATLLEGVSQGRAKPIVAPAFPLANTFQEFPATEKAEEKGHILILHLAELQCGRPLNNSWHPKSLPLMARDLPIEANDLDTILISGDIAFSGKNGEYALAEKFLSSLLADLLIDPSADCFLVPGNHDVDRSSIGPADDSIIDNLKSEEDIARILAHPPTMELLSSRLRNFYEFTQRFLGKARGWRRDRPWRVDVQHKAGLRIATIQLNSAWAVGPNPQSQPVVGEFQVREALTEAEGADLRLWLVHHNLSSIRKKEEFGISSLLRHQTGFDLFFSSHLHLAAARVYKDPNFCEVISGPLYPNASNPTCSLTKLHPNSRTAEIQLFRYADFRQSWIPDGETFLISLEKPKKGAKAHHRAPESAPLEDVTRQAKAKKEQPPQAVSVSPGKLMDQLLGKRPVLIVTAVKQELLEVLSFLSPLPGKESVLRGHVGQETYYLGRYGAETAIVTMCGMGSIGRDSVILATQEALNTFNPIAIIMIGIAFGKDPGKQNLGDVLVASQVVSYEQQRVGSSHTIHRGTIAQTGPVLLNRFRQALDWSFEYEGGGMAQTHFGPLLSGEKLIDKEAYRDELFSAFPQAIGGEMEGAGLYAVADRNRKEWILVKGICDWADGRKSDNFQAPAARAAASLVHHVLSDPTALEALKG